MAATEWASLLSYAGLSLFCNEELSLLNYEGWSLLSYEVMSLFCHEVLSLFYYEVLSLFCYEVSSLFLDQVFTLFCYEVLSRWTHQVISHTWTVEDGWSVVSSFCSRGTPPREVPPVLGPYSASSALVVPLQERSQHLLLSWYPSKRGPTSPRTLQWPDA